MDYIIPTRLILTVASALAIFAITLAIVIFFLVRLWFQKRSTNKN